MNQPELQPLPSPQYPDVTNESVSVDTVSFTFDQSNGKLKKNYTESMDVPSAAIANIHK